MSRIIYWNQVESGMTIKLSHEMQVARLDAESDRKVEDIVFEE